VGVSVTDTRPLEQARIDGPDTSWPQASVMIVDADRQANHSADEEGQTFPHLLVPQSSADVPTTMT
jgi:hypothetical protein